MKQPMDYLQVLQSVFLVVDQVNIRANAFIHVSHVTWAFYLAEPTPDLALEIIYLATAKTRNLKLQGFC